MKTLDSQPLISTADRRLLGEVKALVRSHLPDAEVILYGSVARGEQTPDSDYDVLILTPHTVSPSEEAGLFDDLYELDIRHNVVITPLIYPKQEWYQPARQALPFSRNVLHEGVLV